MKPVKFKSLIKSFLFKFNITITKDKTTNSNFRNTLKDILELKLKLVARIYSGI